MVVSSHEYIKFPFGVYVDDVLELLAEDFAPAYKHVFSYYWNNSMVARVRRNYSEPYFDDALYEFYIPIQAHKEVNMTWFRVCVKVVPEISQEKARELAVDLMKPRMKPAGIVDSELIAIISPTRVGYVHGFKHVPLKGHLTAIICNRNPLKAVNILKKLISKFIEKRVDALLGKFGIQRDCEVHEIWYKKKGSFYYIYNNRNRRRTVPLYYVIRQTVRCLSRFLGWLRRRAKRREFLESLSRQLEKIKGLHEKRVFLRDLWIHIITKHNRHQTFRALKFLEAVATLHV